jgi:hypothetical protein
MPPQPRCLTFGVNFDTGRQREEHKRILPVNPMNNQTDKNDDEPSLVCETSAELGRLAEAKFAGVTYHEVESSGPAAAPLGFPAPKGKSCCIGSQPQNPECHWSILTLRDTVHYSIRQCCGQK